jgi:hypothetical protein
VICLRGVVISIFILLRGVATGVVGRVGFPFLGVISDVVVVVFVVIFVVVMVLET